ncbi:hypothetical protein RYX36_001642, partial [Vicia faba]
DVTWCGKLNAITCASEACISDPSSILSPTFWIHEHIVIPERPTECAVFNVIADSPRDPIQFIEWSPACRPRELLIENFHVRVTIWTQPSQGKANFVLDTSCWLCEHEWWQEISVATKWLSVVSLYGRLSSKSSAHANSKSMFKEKGSFSNDEDIHQKFLLIHSLSPSTPVFVSAIVTSSHFIVVYIKIRDMVQIGEEKENRENEKVSNSNSNSSPNSKNSEEKKTEAEVTVTLSDPEQEQEEEKDPMEMNVEEENEQDSFSPTPSTVFQILLE